MAVFPHLRPFGGTAIMSVPTDHRKAFEESAAALAGARVRHEGRWTWLVREGPLPGSADYTGGWTANRDDLVRAPLGVLWFDDDLGLFKRSPQPIFVVGEVRKALTLVKQFRRRHDVILRSEHHIR